MRTHSQIIVDAGGATKLAEALPLDDAGPVHQWRRNDSIPGPYWNRIAELGHASLEELAQAAEARKFPDLAANRDQQAAA